MKYAIDRYAVGREIEVDADQFEDSYIPMRKDRFYCPECGEKVFFRNRGGFLPSHFYHQEKTAQTPECDNRVDGRSVLSLSQRVGLPIFLSHSANRFFHLSIGFPPLGIDLLEKATKEQSKIDIKAGKQFKTWEINNSNFIADETTLIPIDIIPPNGNNYEFIISGKGSTYGIQRKWSDYADGFDKGGAIFSFDERCGKKIRRGDSIATNRNYYVVSKSSLRCFPTVKQGYVGQLTLSHEKYSIYIVRINVSIDDERSFIQIADYYKSQFGVGLLECSPELVPLWPPIVQHDYLVPVLQNSSIICAIESGNTVPNVYEYSEYGVSSKEIKHDYNGIKTVEIKLGKNPVTLSVDRKYVGREVSFFSKAIQASNHRYEIDICNKAGVSIPWDEVNEAVLSSDLFIKANSKMELYTGSKDFVFRQIHIRDQITGIPAIKNTDKLFLNVGFSIIQRIVCKSETIISDKKKDLVKRIQEVRKRQMVAIPNWADYIIRKEMHNHNDMLLKVIIEKIDKGQIPVEVLKILRSEI